MDGLDTPKTMIKAAIKNGLDGLAITDHNTVKGGLVAKSLAKRYRFLIITGSEIRSASGDILALGIKEDAPVGLGVQETIEKIHDLGGIAVAAHPFSGYFFRKCVGEKAREADAIEAFNSRNIFSYPNEKAARFADMHKKPKVGSSDAHWAKSVGMAGIICDSDPLESILKGKVKIFGRYTPFSNMLAMYARKATLSLRYNISKTL